MASSPSLHKCIIFFIYFEPGGRLRGWLGGEEFYNGLPTSYWADEIQQWEAGPGVIVEGGGVWISYKRKSHWIIFLWPWPDANPRWPDLLDGEAVGIPVLHQLKNHSSPEVRDWARISIERIQTGQRGPQKRVPFR